MYLGQLQQLNLCSFGVCLMLIMTPQETNNLEHLLKMEAQAKEGVKAIEIGANLLSLAVHEIYSKQLYLAHLDDRGLPMYPNQTSYEPHLLQELSISRATLYNHYTPAKIAMGGTFNLSPEEFIATGGKVTWSVLGKDFLDYNEDTGEVKSLSDGRPLEPDILVETLKEMNSPGPSELSLRPSSVRKVLAEKLGFEPTYQSSIQYVEGEYNRVTQLKSVYAYVNGEQKIAFYLPATDEVIIDDILKQLKVRKER